MKPETQQGGMWMTIEQFAERHGASCHTVRLWIRRGLPHCLAKSTGRPGRPRKLIDADAASIWLAVNGLARNTRASSRAQAAELRLPEIADDDSINDLVLMLNTDALRSLSRDLRSGDQRLREFLLREHRNDLATLGQLALDAGIVAQTSEGKKK